MPWLCDSLQAAHAHGSRGAAGLLLRSVLPGCAIGEGDAVVRASDAKDDVGATIHRGGSDKISQPSAETEAESQSYRRIA